MTLISELRGHTHRCRISHALSLVNRLVRWEKFTNDCTLVARCEATTDTYLRDLLRDCPTFWEFDEDRAVLVRRDSTTDDFRVEIDVSQLLADDVYRIVRETEPSW